MDAPLFYTLIMAGLTVVGLIVFFTLFFISAPYGRYRREGWGPEIDGRAGWVIMESISFFGFILFFLLGNWKQGGMPFVFLFLWMLHYFYRSFIFSSLMRGGKKIPLSIAAFAIVFNSANSFIQGYYLYFLAGPAGKYSAEWLGKPQFIIGVLVFLTGYIIHIKSDQILRNLREPGEKEYKIPEGWLYRWVSCPNYLGEITEWIGWAILTWSLPGAVFALWTFFNLFPRAVSHHRWYRENFDDYPEIRKAVVPGII